MSLRNGKAMPQSSSPTSMTASSSTRTASTYRSRPSPYLLLIYPIIIALGSAFYYISPVARSQANGYAAPFTPGVVSDQHATAIPHTLSYFADKRNVVNVYFVKRGWFWTTLAFVLLPLTVLPQSQSQLPSASPTSGATRPSRVLRSYLRYFLVTISWIFTTQWFFGPALTDRSFTLTGGHCEAIPTRDGVGEETAAKLNVLPTVVSELACRAAGGHWRGGHDVSGHAFMMVLSSAFLLYELNILDSLSSHPSISPRAAATLSKELSDEEKSAVGGWESSRTATTRIWVRRFVYMVVGLDLWMLMMTAVFFHTWLEKLNGLVIASASLWLVYFLGDIVPAWGAIVGLS